MQSFKDKIVAGLTQGIEGLFKRNKVEYIKVNTLLMDACMHAFIRSSCVYCMDAFIHALNCYSELLEGVNALLGC